MGGGGIEDQDMYKCLECLLSMRLPHVLYPVPYDALRVLIRAWKPPKHQEINSGIISTTDGVTSSGPGIEPLAQLDRNCPLRPQTT